MARCGAGWDKGQASPVSAVRVHSGQLPSVSLVPKDLSVSHVACCATWRACWRSHTPPWGPRSHTGDSRRLRRGTHPRRVQLSLVFSTVTLVGFCRSWGGRGRGTEAKTCPSPCSQESPCSQPCMRVRDDSCVPGAYADS